MTVGFLTVFRFSWAHWRRHPLSMFVLAVGTLLMTATEVVIPFAIGGLTDAVSSNMLADAAQDGSGGLNVEQRFQTAFRWLMFLTGLYFLYHLLHKGGDYLWCHVQCGVMARLYHEAFAKVQRMSSRWHAETFAGKTVRNISRGVWGFDDFGDVLYFHLLPSLCVVFAVLVVLAVKWPIIGLVFVVSSSVFIAVSIWMNVAIIAPIRRRAVEADSEVSGVVADSITCNAVVKAAAAEGREDDRLKTQLQRWRGHFVRTWNMSIHTGVVQAALLNVMQFILVATTVWYWAHGQATAGDVAFMLFTTFLVHNYLRDVGMHIRNLQQAVNDMEHIVAYSTAVPEIEDAPGAAPLIVKQGGIRFDNVSFGYQKVESWQKVKSWLFDGLDVEIMPGEQIALVGRSGSGKTTFTKLLQRLYEIDGGRILVDGQDIRQATLASVRQNMALVPQEPILFHRTLAENIAYARPNASFDEIRHAAEQAHAADFIEALPQGFQTLVGERGVKLSGGERQRVAIARAILANCPILILDEATSSLDSVSENLIQDALTRLMAGRTTIIIAHRLSTIRHADRIFVFEKGRIVEQGPHDALIGQDGVYARLHDAQNEAYSGGVGSPAIKGLDPVLSDG